MARGAAAPEEGTLSLLSFPRWLCPARGWAMSDSLASGAGTRWRTGTGLGTSPSSAARPSSCSFLPRQPGARPTPNLWRGGPRAPFPAVTSWPRLAAGPGASRGRSEVQRPSCKGAAEQQLQPALARIIRDSSLGSVRAADFPVAQWGLGRGRQTCCSAVNPR